MQLFLRKKLFGIPLLFLLFFSILAAIFIVFPNIDIWFSRLFYHPSGHFHLRNAPLSMVVYHSVSYLAIFFFIMLVVLFFISFFRKKAVLFFTKKNIIYLLLVMALGPGLVVNFILKDHTGRPRPSQISQFGGDSIFMPAFIPSKQDGFSFVSGHASFGFYLVALAFIANQHRKKIFTVALLYGAVIGFVRIVQGRHFLSDVIFSFFFTYCTAKIVFYFMYKGADRAT